MAYVWLHLSIKKKDILISIIISDSEFHSTFSSLSTSFIFLSRPAPKNEDEMMLIIFDFIDRIFSIVRPRRLLYMAIDGVVSASESCNLEALIINWAINVLKQQKERCSLFLDLFIKRNNITHCC